jgi:hypothetical protein
MLAPFIIASPEPVVEDYAAGIGLQSAARQTATTVVDGKRALRVELPLIKRSGWGKSAHARGPVGLARPSF